MSLLLKKLNHSNAAVLSWPVIRAKDPPIERGPLPPAQPTGKRIPFHRLRIRLIFLCYPAKPKIPKTAWEFYNEGMYAAVQPHTV